MSNEKFNLRALRPSDSPALIALITEFDGDMVTQFQVDAYSGLIFGTENQTMGVGVECAGIDGLIGLGTVRYNQVQFNGEILPLAFLDGLKVRKEFRGQGLGYQIASWRIQQARQTFGERCVIATGMLSSNAASRAVAKKWCREFIDSAYSPFFLPYALARPGRWTILQCARSNPANMQNLPLSRTLITKTTIFIHRSPRNPSRMPWT